MGEIVVNIQCIFMSINSTFLLLSFPKYSAENHTVDRSYYHQYTNTGRHINNLLVRIELIKLK